MASVARAYPSRAYNGVTIDHYILATNTLAYFAKALPVSDNEKKVFYNIDNRQPDSPVYLTVEGKPPHSKTP
jgi:hypothetical protein